MSLTEDSQTDIDRNTDQSTVAASGGGRGRGLVTLGLSKDSHTGINRHADQTIAGGLLLAFGLSKDGRAESNGHANQAVTGVETVVADESGRDLVTLGFSKNCNTCVEGHADQPLGDGLLLACSLSEDGCAEINGHANQAISGLDSL